MSFSMNSSDIFQTIHMIAEENLDIRTTTMGISLKDCVSESTETTCRKIYDKITTMAEISCQLQRPSARNLVFQSSTSASP